MDNSNKMDRRRFIRTASCAAIGSATLFNTLFNLGMTSEAAARTAKAYKVHGQYKALVCILLSGGNDSFNMLVPSQGSEYEDYKKHRFNIALDQDKLLPLSPLAGSQIPLGLHPSMPEVQALFNAGRIAFLSNTGTLVEPTSKAQYDTGSVSLPLGLFSHSDQVQQWQTSVPQSRNANGWGGRMADILQSMNSNQNISMNISLSGRNVFQSGYNTAEYAILPTGDGSIGLTGYKGPSLLDQIRTQAVDSLLEQQYNDVFTRSYADIVRASQNTHELFSASVGSANLSTAFSDTELSNSLNMVARTIASRESLDVVRQTFFVSFGGWDHHDWVKNKQTDMLAELSKGLNEFNAALEELGLATDVTTFLISDFARTLTSNGNGTDHAWGGNVLVMGGAVNGGQIYGQYPSLAKNSPLNVGNGVLLPTLSTDEYFAELAQWFGVTNGDLPTILPNLSNFYTPGPTPPIGFMQL